MYKIGLLLVLSLVEGRPQISLGYQPTRPFYHPQPAGSHIGQIVPPGKPWPANQQNYESFSQLSPGNIVDRIKETEAQKGSTTASSFLWPAVSETENANATSGIKEPDELVPPNTGSINIEYKPMRPSHHPNPGDYIKPIIPPSNPWPARPEDYPNFSQTTSIPIIVDRIEVSVPSSTVKATTSSGATQEPTAINIEYQPMRPPYHPNPGDYIKPIIPPSNPWPARPEDYPNFSQTTSAAIIVDRIEDSVPSSTQKPAISSGATQPNNPIPEKPTTTGTISLEYKPMRPSYHPNPGDYIKPIVPPSNPWPARPEDYPNFSQTTDTPIIVDRIEIPSSTEKASTSSGTTQKPTAINIEYQPMRPPFHPNPGDYIKPIIPPSKPWPARPEDYPNFSQTTSTPIIVDRIDVSVLSSTQKESTSGATNRPFYNPNQGNTVGQVVAPQGSGGAPCDKIKEEESKRTSTTPATGFIWHSNLKNQANATFITKQPNDLLPVEDSTTSNKKPVTLVDRIQDSVASSSESTSTSVAIQKQAPVSLEYKPNRPFYHPSPGNTIAQIVPSGKPWPASPEGYQNFSQGGNTNLVNRIQDTKQTTKVPTTAATQGGQKRPISLEYQPNPPFHASGGNTISPIIPSGQPWPASAEGYQNFNQAGSPDFVNRIQDTSSSVVKRSTTVPTTAAIESEQKKPISLEYQPNPPFHASGGNTISPMIPPGQPWPANEEGYQNFSQVGNPDLVNRIQETGSSVVKQTTTVPTTAAIASEQKEPISLEYQPNPPFHASGGNTISPFIPPGQPWPASAEGYQNFSQISAPDLVNRIQETSSKRPQSTSTSKTVVLEYQPTRPSFHPSPGNNIGEIVPPGKPWPSSVEGYQNFSQIPSPRPNLEERIKDEIPPSTQKAQTPASVPENTSISSGEEKPAGFQMNSLLLERLEELVNKRKMQTTSEPPQSGFRGETETSSEKQMLQNEQAVNTTSYVTENSSIESSSEETSTIDATTKVVQSATDGKLYTSPPLLSRVKTEAIFEHSVPAVAKQEGYKKANVESSPFVLFPFNWSPSHYIFYI